MILGTWPRSIICIASRTLSAPSCGSCGLVGSVLLGGRDVDVPTDIKLSSRSIAGRRRRRGGLASAEVVRGALSRPPAFGTAPVLPPALLRAGSAVAGRRAPLCASLSFMFADTGLSTRGLCRWEGDMKRKENAEAETLLSVGSAVGTGESRAASAGPFTLWRGSRWCWCWCGCRCSFVSADMPMPSLRRM